ncbi:dual specificity protein phosphatase 12 [mine drainage metagenome]|uniref:Dual specificity protein phosphatase 12 n=1 Tax=mine drainage metagenome TaxID=410659 RepID=T1CSJ2_9ZZZZ
MPETKKKSGTRAKARTTQKSPSEIAPGVFVGGRSDALRFAGAKFCVLDEAPDSMPTATHVPIYDAAADRAVPANLDRLAASIRQARTKGEAVLVFCGHGVRRSPLGAAWYLHTTEGISLDAAYDRIRAVRPKVEHARDWIGNHRNLEGG